MRARTWPELAWFGLTTVLTGRHDPSSALSSSPTAATSPAGTASWPTSAGSTTRGSASGPTCSRWTTSALRFLLLYGGEPFLWRDGEHRLRDVVAEARRMGFAMVAVVTNGTYGLDLAEADLIFVSVDGTPSTTTRSAPPTTRSWPSSPPPLATTCASTWRSTGSTSPTSSTSAPPGTCPPCGGVLQPPHPLPGHRAPGACTRGSDEGVRAIERPLPRRFPILNSATPSPPSRRTPGRRPVTRRVIVEDGQQIGLRALRRGPGPVRAVRVSILRRAVLLFSGRRRVVADAVRTSGPPSETPAPATGRSQGRLRATLSSESPSSRRPAGLAARGSATDASGRTPTIGLCRR